MDVCEKCGGKEWIATGEKYRTNMTFKKKHLGKESISTEVFLVSEFICGKCKQSKRYYPDYMENVFSNDENAEFLNMPDVTTIENPDQKSK